MTAFLLLLWGEPVSVADDQASASAAAQPSPDTTATVPQSVDSVDDAANTLRDLVFSFYGYLPRLLIVLAIVALAGVVLAIARRVIERALSGWERTAAVIAVTRLAVFLVAGIAILTVLAGDVRAVVGSVGLLGLAASWALQTPIESFTGWLLNSFRGYYRVGDRIAVGDVFGDVYRIDVLTTTVWEAGGPGKPVAAAQATGALITFPNWEVLRSNVVNYSRDFPHVWDEISVNVANESDLAYCSRVLASVARRVLGPQMEEAVEQYQALLTAQRLRFDVDEVPRVYLSTTDAWTVCTIRYLVPVRTRRRFASDLVLAISQELARPEHAGRVLSVYPRTEITVRDQWPGPGAGSTSAPDSTG